MKKIISTLLIITLLGFLGYEHREIVIDHTMLIIDNPTTAVLNANLHRDEDVYTFDSDIYGQIQLDAGTEPTYGFRHILARHTSKYFINFEDKNSATLFEDDVTGNDLILGMKEFYKHCVAVEAYNRRSDRNTAYVGFTTLNGNWEKCLLIVRKENNQIVTFYPFREIREREILEEIQIDALKPIKESNITELQALRDSIEEIVRIMEDAKVTPEENFQYD